MNQILFIRKPGAQLKKESNSLLVFHQGKRSGIYPLENVDAMVLMGPVEISSAMIKYAVKRKIQIVWTDMNGIFKAMVKSSTAKNVVVRMLQYHTLLNQEQRIKIAREWVRSKIANLLELTRKIQSPVYAELRNPAHNAFTSLEEAKSVEQIRGIEGGFAAVYFRFFPGMLIHSMGFKKRTKRPPKDPVNALLSFGYTLLFMNAFALVESKGLDPYLGFLHDIRYGHPAFVSDLIEPMRFIIDKTVIDLINQELIGMHHFKKEEGVTLTREGLKIFTEKIQENFHSPFSWKDKEKESILRRMEKNVTHFIRYIGKKETDFRLEDWK